MEKEKKYLIFITGGHATPAVACINELKKRGYNNLVYIGQKKSLLFDKNVSSEYRLITEKVLIPFKSLITGKISLFWHINSLIWLARLPVGFIQAFWWHITMRPRLVLTFGSHLGLPVVFWAWVFHTPVIAHEQTVTLGRANRIIQRLSTKICYSWQEILTDNEEKKAVKDIKSKVANTRFIYTGNPVRAELFTVKTDEFIFSDTKKKTIFVTGGNQGAHTLNEFIFNNLESITREYNVIHQTGSNSIYNDIGKAQEIASRLNKNSLVYIPMNYIFVEEMAEAYDKAFVVIARGGANTITELLTMKKKGILIPIPTSAGNEQFLNSQMLADLGLGLVLPQSDLDKIDLLEVLKKVERITITDHKMVDLVSSMHRDAEKRIIDIVENKLKKLLV